VLTSGPVLGTLAQVIGDGRSDVRGCLDAAQCRDVLRQWRHEGSVTWKLPLLLRIVPDRFSGKESTPWRPDSPVHDFMHAKLTVADDVVFLGSFNLSHSGERNAENVLEIADAEIAEQLAAFAEAVCARYPPLALR
jgi:phosphatidylserine/phosphatidylglycerophosphate/cardiolipin synthase-like enzyme